MGTGWDERKSETFSAVPQYSAVQVCEVWWEKLRKYY